MKAYVLDAAGQFAERDMPKPKPQKDEVLVAVRAAGICGSDIPRIYGSGAYHYPLVPGHEFSGVVVQCGLVENERWLGKRVGVFPLIPCRTCASCRAKKYELCRGYSYLGSRRDGGFAEYVSVPVWNLIELPDAVSYEQAAMLEPMAVAVHALRRIGFSREEYAAVCGMGAIGLLALGILAAWGIKNVLAIGNKAFQREFVRKLGIGEDNFCDNTKENADGWISERTRGQDLAAFFDCAGKAESVSLGIRNMSPEGKVVLVGNPAGTVGFSAEDYGKILRNQLSVTGSWNSSFTHENGDDWHVCLELLRDGKLKPELLLTHKFSFDRLAEGAELMRDKKEPYIKIMAVYENEELL